ncbi:hypothetical protein PEX1_071800 [Penicillium expansum]|uniref:Uncharacterized protein n=1 Tax=Penicillium expansum TaxID=27334 RepID=A0A0A2K6A2_PENEN|nr:hypothetical protein PEX2_054780 [Penicillium expansum]KGO48173.1 hypothetical protein PEXP_040120 [Penicillium expansum]KGO59900.1 hypothetical protein PEX2_054780 [Penicillium expansum]KGO71018.1 hypothetical protein PEX1_071800 [Penicillium expansum]
MLNNFQAFAVALLAGFVTAIDLKANDEQSFKNVAATAALNTMSMYTSNITGHNQNPDLLRLDGGDLGH